MTNRTVARIGALSMLVVVFTAALAGPAMADPAGPTNYESTVLDVEPASTVAAFRVVGGDAFLEVTVAEGHTVDVPGYFSEPYIRIDADGTVWVNDDSQALYLNEDRYASTGVPESADGDGEPRWRQVATGGVYAWHDHRVHWMSRDVPPAVAGETRQLVFPWRLPVVVDGVETVISGELVWVPSLSPIVPMLAGITALLPLTVSRRIRLHAPAILTTAAAGLAAVIIVAQNNATPPSARGAPVWLVFPLVALSAAIWASTRGRLAGLTTRHLLLIGGAALAMWGISTIEVLSMPILPSEMPSGLERAGVAFVIWAGLGVAVTAAIDTLRVARRAGPATSS